MNFRVIILLITLLLGGTAAGWSLDKTSLPDSLLNEDKVYEYTFSNPALAKQIMSILRAKKANSEFELDITEGDLMYNTGSCYHALSIYKRALASKEAQVNHKRRLELLHRMISCYDAVHNDTKKMQYVKQLLDDARRQGNKAMESVALFNMGNTVYYQGDKANGYKFMLNAVELMKKTDYKNKYDNLRYDYNILIVFYLRDGKLEDAYRVLTQLSDIIEKSSGKEKSMDGLDVRERKTLYANYAVILNRLGKVREAETYYRKFMNLEKIYHYDDNMIFPYLFDRKMYNEAIHMAREGERRLIAGGDTINYHMSTYLKSLGEAFDKKGDYKKAANYFRRLSVLRDSLKSREQQSSALELAALYDSSEKDIQIREQLAKAHIKNIFLISSCCIILYVAIQMIG